MKQQLILAFVLIFAFQQIQALPQLNIVNLTQLMSENQKSHTDFLGLLMNRHQMEAFAHEVFVKYDVNDDENISLEEFERVVQDHFKSADQHQYQSIDIQAIFEKYDTNQNQKLDEHEFTLFLKHFVLQEALFQIQEESSLHDIIIDENEKDKVANYVFDKMDTNGSGSLDRNEFYNGLSILSQNLHFPLVSKEDSDSLFDEADLNRSGELDRDEFKLVFGQIVDSVQYGNNEKVDQLLDRRSQVQQLVDSNFNEIDVNGDGLLSVNEIHAASLRIAEQFDIPQMKFDDVVYLIQILDIDMNGGLDRDEFFNYVVVLLENQKRVQIQKQNKEIQQENLEYAEKIAKQAYAIQKPRPPHKHLEKSKNKKSNSKNLKRQ